MKDVIDENFCECFKLIVSWVNSLSSAKCHAELISASMNHENNRAFRCTETMYGGYEILKRVQNDMVIMRFRNKFGMTS